MQQSPLCTLYLYVVFLERLHTALPHQSSSMALAKRANGKWTTGAPAALSAHVLFMSRGRRDAPRHTPCQKHTLSCTPEPLTTLPLQTTSYTLKPPWHFHFMCCCAPIPPSKESDNSNSWPWQQETLSWNVIQCNIQLAVSRYSSKSCRCHVNMIMWLLVMFLLYGSISLRRI